MTEGKNRAVAPRLRRVAVVSCLCGLPHFQLLVMSCQPRKAVEPSVIMLRGMKRFCWSTELQVEVHTLPACPL